MRFLCMSLVIVVMDTNGLQILSLQTTSCVLSETEWASKHSNMFQNQFAAPSYARHAVASTTTNFQCHDMFYFLIWQTTG